jgi:hypothetical protein
MKVIESLTARVFGSFDFTVAVTVLASISLVYLIRLAERATMRDSIKVAVRV